MKKSSCGFGEEDCFMFVIVNLWELMTLRVGAFMTLGAWLAGFIKRSTTHCYTQIMRALRLVVSEKKMLCFFYVFPMTPPGVGPVWNPWARLEEFTKRTFIRSYKQKRKFRALWFWRRRFFLCLSYFHDEDCKSVGANDPWVGAIFIPGAWLAGFIKRTTINC